MIRQTPFQHYLLGLFAVANNIPAIPLFLSLCQGLSKYEKRRLSFIAATTSFITMVVSVFIGTAVLGFFGIDIDAFRIAGGLLLVFSGLGMLNAKPLPLDGPPQTKFSDIISKAVIPIAIPLTTGAGTISTLVLFAESAHSATPLLQILAAVVCITLINYATFFYSPGVQRILGHTGMDVLTKIFGLITLALGVQFIITGLSHSFPVLMK